MHDRIQEEGFTYLNFNLLKKEINHDEYGHAHMDV